VDALGRRDVPARSTSAKDRRAARAPAGGKAIGGEAALDVPIDADAAIVALSTAGSREEAERLAQILVGERLAACVNIVAPLTSVYRWKGAVERAEEVLLVIKTRQSLARRLISRVQELHSYDVPELIVLPIVEGAESYLGWLMAETKPTTDRQR
jgi:periplasmic divalent cation tolerance protein